MLDFALKQARAALKVKERATAERMIEISKEGSPRVRSDALASLDLQLKVDVSSVEWCCELQSKYHLFFEFLLEMRRWWIIAPENDEFVLKNGRPFCNWRYMMDRSWEPITYLKLDGYGIKQEHFADLSTKSEISIEDFVMMEDEKNKVFGRKQLPPLPGQAVDKEDKLLTVNWKTEGRWKAGIKIFDR